MGSGSGPGSEVAVRPRAARRAHLVLLVVADAAHQVLQVLVEHAVDAALDHLEGHRGGRRRARAPGGPRPGAVRWPGGRACRPRSAALPGAAAGRASRPGLQRSGGGGSGDRLGRPRSPLLLLAPRRWQMADKMAAGQLTAAPRPRAPPPEAPPPSKAPPLHLRDATFP